MDADQFSDDELRELVTGLIRQCRLSLDQFVEPAVTRFVEKRDNAEDFPAALSAFLNSAAALERLFRK